MPQVRQPGRSEASPPAIVHGTDPPATSLALHYLISGSFCFPIALASGRRPPATRSALRQSATHSSS